MLARDGQRLGSGPLRELEFPLQRIDRSQRSERVGEAPLVACEPRDLGGLFEQGTCLPHLVLEEGEEAEDGERARDNRGVV